MPRPLAGEPSVSTAPAPYQAPPGGLSLPPAPSPFNYTNQPTPPTGPTVATTPTPAGLWNAFRRRWVLGTFIGGLIAAAAAVGLWMAMPAGKHQARVLVQLQPKQHEFVHKSQEDFEAYRRHQMFLITTREVLTLVLADPAVSSLDMVKGSEDPVAMLEDGLKVKVAAPEILEVSLTGNNIDDMKVILDHLMKQYMEKAASLDRKTRDEEVKQLEKAAHTLQQDIMQREGNIKLHAGDRGITGSGDTASSALAAHYKRRDEAEAMANACTNELGRLEDERKVLTQELENKDPKATAGLDPFLVDQAVKADGRYKKAKEALDTRREYLKGQEETATEPDKDATIIGLRAELKKQEAAFVALEKTVKDEVVTVQRVLENERKRQRVTKLDTDIKIKTKERERYQEVQKNAQQAINNTAGDGVNLEAQKAALVPLRDAYNRIQVQLIQHRNSTSVSRVSARPAEGVPNNNQNKKIAVSTVGGIGSFLGVVLLVAFLEWRTRRIDGVDQVVTELGMRVIGTVPVFPNRANLQAATEAGGANWRFVLNESINSTRTMLLHIAKGQSMQVVMVTSATQGEGKTSLASQLATSMATAGMRTLIIDCDLRNPSVMKLFELPLTPGVSEVLRQEVDVTDAVQTTAVPNLWVIPAGQCSNATIAALAQGHPLETLFNRLRGQFDFVIVDSCPVLPVADALLIAQHVDGVVFSIMQDISQLPKVITASEKLAQLNIPLIGAVVNGIKQDVSSYGYNYVKQLPA